MTRSEATYTLQKLINSGVLSDEVCEELTEMCRALCDEDFEMCDGSDKISSYCYECRHFQKE